MIIWIENIQKTHKISMFDLNSESAIVYAILSYAQSSKINSIWYYNGDFFIMSNEVSIHTSRAFTGEVSIYKIVNNEMK
jgi:hypothetical protein